MQEIAVFAYILLRYKTSFLANTYTLSFQLAGSIQPKTKFETACRACKIKKFYKAREQKSQRAFAPPFRYDRVRLH